MRQSLEKHHNMLIQKKITTILTITAFLFSLMLINAPQGWSITIQQERELSKEFMGVIKARYRLIKDPVVVDYLNRVGNRILDAIPPQPFKYKFYVIQEDVYNAFATPAGHIFINSGLFGALESEEELAGIMGHEIAHVVCRHISQRIDRSKKIGMATLAGMVAGVLLGAGGAGEAAGAVTMGSMAAGQSIALAYSRENEMQADQLGLKFLTQAGYTGWGLLTSLKKIRSKQWYGSDQVPTYLMTHPASEERMSYIDSLLSQKKYQTAEKTPLVGGFDLAHTRVVALYTDADLALAHYEKALARTPDDPMVNYGYALTLTRKDHWREAAEHMKKALEGNAMAPHMLQDLGKIYFHDGKYDKAVNALSSSGTTDDPQIQLYLGRARMETGEMSEAKKIFKELVYHHQEYTKAYYYLGECCERMQDKFGAHYNLGRYYSRRKDMENAEFHLKQAMKLAANDEQKQLVRSAQKAFEVNKKGKGKEKPPSS